MIFVSAGGIIPNWIKIFKYIDLLRRDLNGMVRTY